VLLAYAFALENPQVHAEAVEASEFMDLARTYRVMGVPRTVVNGTRAVDGSMPEAVFLDAVLEAAQPPPATDPAAS
jgi:predicted DsbA family dithiol-disulfide isomerase